MGNVSLRSTISKWKKAVSSKSSRVLPYPEHPSSVLRADEAQRLHGGRPIQLKTHGTIHHHSIHRRQSGGDCRFYVASGEGVSYERPPGAAGRLSLTMDRLGYAAFFGGCYLWTARRARRALSTYIASEKSYLWTAPRARRALSTYSASEKSYLWTAPRARRSLSTYIASEKSYL